MSHIIIVTGSARPTSIAKKVLPVIEGVLSRINSVDTSVVNVAELQLPFYDSPAPASQEDFAPTDKHVKAWTEMIASADGVILLTPEYNGNMTGIQKNAIDWVFKEWNGKPVALIGYGWYEASRAHAAAQVSLSVVKAKTVEPFAQLQFMKDISVEGEVIDSAAVSVKIETTLNALVDVIDT